MSEVPPQIPIADNPQPKTPDNIGLLTTLCRVLSGLLHVCGLFPCIHFSMGLLLLFAPMFVKSSANSTPGDAAFISMFGGIFVVISGAIILIIQGVALLGWRVARWIEERRNYNWCMAHSIVCCLFTPVGIAYGVFALITLTNKETKSEFTS